MRSFYFLQSAYTIYLRMGMAIYLSYLLLEVVMLIRITILNIFNRIDLIEQKQIIHLKRQKAWLNRDRLESDEER